MWDCLNSPRIPSDDSRDVTLCADDKLDLGLEQFEGTPRNIVEHRGTFQNTVESNRVATIGLCWVKDASRSFFISFRAVTLFRTLRLCMGPEVGP